ncbi:xylulokinase, partial [Burkholderia pseudomallei]
LFAGIARLAPNPGDAVQAFCLCLPARWHLMSVILWAAASLDWFAKTHDVAFDRLPALAVRADASRGPLFLPYLSGERTPH